MADILQQIDQIDRQLAELRQAVREEQTEGGSSAGKRSGCGSGDADH